MENHSDKSPRESFIWVLIVAFVWQSLPLVWMTWDLWDVNSNLISKFQSVIYLIIPVLAGVIHKSWKIALACLGFMIVMLIFPSVILIFQSYYWIGLGTAVIIIVLVKWIKPELQYQFDRTKDGHGSDKASGLISFMNRGEIIPDDTQKRAIVLSIVWQLNPAAWMMWDLWDSPSVMTVILRAVVFLIVPIIAGLVHRSWKVAIACWLMPVFAIGLMMTIFMFMMPLGKW